MQALNAYSGAVILVSHDRHMVELTADRLVLVDEGTAREFQASLEDYTDLILGRNQPKGAGGKEGKKDRKAAAAAREQAQALRKQVQDYEKEVVRLTADRSAIDLAMFDPSQADAALAKLAMSELMKRRAEVAAALEDAEARWMEASEALEQQAA